MDYSTLTQEIELPATLEEIDPTSMYAAFEKVTDGRHKRGIRYPIALLLTLIMLAKLAGEPKLSGVSQWVRRLRRLAQRAAALRAHTVACCLNVHLCA